ncbi:MAG TPA: hypothetical protein VJH21_01300 [Candidatus Paceibacterota bacterium]
MYHLQRLCALFALPLYLVTPEDCDLSAGRELRLCQELLERALEKPSTYEDALMALVRHDLAISRQQRAREAGLTNEATDWEIEEALKKREEYTHCLITIPRCLISQEKEKESR